MATITEDFEDTTYNVSFIGGHAWGRSQLSVRPGGGEWAFKSPVTAHGGTSDLHIIVPDGAVTLQFWYVVSSEENWDFFRVFTYDGVDYTQFLVAHGIGVWTQSSVIDVSGADWIMFRYAKDDGNSIGLDAAFIDDVTFTTPAVAGIPSFTSRPNRVWRLH